MQMIKSNKSYRKNTIKNDKIDEYNMFKMKEKY